MYRYLKKWSKLLNQTHQHNKALHTTTQIYILYVNFHFVVLHATIRCDHMRPRVSFFSVLWSHIGDHASAATLHTAAQIYTHTFKWKWKNLVLMLDFHFEFYMRPSDATTCDHVSLFGSVLWSHIRDHASAATLHNYSNILCTFNEYVWKNWVL